MHVKGTEAAREQKELEIRMCRYGVIFRALCSGPLERAGCARTIQKTRQRIPHVELARLPLHNGLSGPASDRVRHCGLATPDARLPANGAP